MLESKAGKVRKAGGKDVCAGICVAGRERNVKGGSDRVRERNERKNASERTRVRKQERRHKSIVVHGDTHMYTAQTHGNTYRYIHATYMRHKDTQYYIYTTP